MKDKFSKHYFGHLTFYQITSTFSLPISAIIDSGGITICFGFWGFFWTWKKENDEVYFMEENNHDA